MIEYRFTFQPLRCMRGGRRAQFHFFANKQPTSVLTHRSRPIDHRTTGLVRRRWVFRVKFDVPIRPFSVFRHATFPTTSAAASLPVGNGINHFLQTPWLYTGRQAGRPGQPYIYMRLFIFFPSTGCCSTAGAAAAAAALLFGPPICICATHSAHSTNRRCVVSTNAILISLFTSSTWLG